MRTATRSEFDALLGLDPANRQPVPTWARPAPIRASRTVRPVSVFVRLLRYVSTQR